MASLAAMPAKGKFKLKRSLHIDMTPMVDLAFLLLTFFIMTTTLMKQPAMEIQQAAADNGLHKEIKAENVLNLVLGKNDQVYWYIGMPGSKTTLTDYSSTGIRKVLIQKKAEIRDLYVFIKASDQSRYQNMIDVLDEIMITNIADYSLVDMEPEDNARVSQLIP